MERYWHGGAPDLRPGDRIEPRKAGDDHHLLDDCPTCQARREGRQLEHDDNDPALVYVTTDREYARLYAAGYPNGALYRVKPLGELVDRSNHDPVPSWGCKAALVLAVYDPVVPFTPKLYRQMQRKLGIRR